jgi:hypothetical protein
MSEIWDLDVTDANNTLTGFGFPENMNPSDVNDNLRAILGALARWYGDTNGTLVSAGTGGAYTIASPNRSWTTSYSDGAVLMFQAHTVCSSAPTLAVDGKTAKTIMKNATTTVSASDIIQDQICLVAYESTGDKWQLLSPVSGSNGLPLLADNNLSDVGSAATAFSNIKQAASDSATGVVELAIASEVNTGTDATRSITPDALAGSNYGTAVVQILVFDDATDCATGDGAGDVFFRVPSTINGFDLVGVAAQCQTAGTTGTMDVQIHNVTQAADMLTTKLTIDSAETDSSTAATAAVIDTANDDVATGDQIRIDVDAVHTTAAKGLLVELQFRLP